jgi:hypothetical protein
MSLSELRQVQNDRLSAYPAAEGLVASFRQAALAAGGTESTAGFSVEGRPLLRFDIGSNTGPTILLTALMHGNEVIGSLALLEVLRRLGSHDPDIARMRREAHFAVLPIVNPDAFFGNIEKVARGERAWQRCNSSGVDLNRNFPRLTTRRLYHPFSGSRFRASPYYAGLHPFSEPESRAVRQVAIDTKPVLSIAFHSFGNLLLYPWAYTKNENPRADAYASLGNALNQGLGQDPYRVRQACQLYSVLGDMDDWLDAELGALSFTLEVSRPEFAWRELRHMLNPFCWMNPRHAARVTGHVAPGVLSLVSQCLGHSVDTRPVDSRRASSRGPLDLAAK